MQRCARLYPYVQGCAGVLLDMQLQREMHLAIGRVLRVQGPTIGAYVWGVASALDDLLGAVVAGGAQRLQGCGDEGGPVATMGLDVVGDGGDGDDTALQAEGAEWKAQELRTTASLPAGSSVEVIPWDFAHENGGPRWTTEMVGDVEREQSSRSSGCA